MDGTLVETVVEGHFTFIDGPAGLALDPISGMLYWTDFVNDKISRTDLTTGTTETLISTGLVVPLGIALDLDSGWFYWVDAAAGTVQRANLNGSGVVELLADLDNPRDVDLDSNGGKLYWVDLFGGVFRANLDGTEPELVAPNVQDSSYLTLDLANGKVYWGDGSGVSRANLDGSDIERGVVSGVPVVVFGVAIVPEEDILGGINGDGEVNRDDFVLFHDCLAGPNVPLDPGCCRADFDGNGYIDLADVAEFQVVFTGGF